MCRNVGKNISKILNLLMMLKSLLQMHLKLPQKKAAEATDDLIGNKIAYKITRAPKTSQNKEEIFRERFISSKLRQKLLMI